MKTVESIEEMRATRQFAKEGSWALVPTMGYLHEGHLSLVRRARQQNDYVAISIFVNPTQFAPNEDLQTYPRDLDRDLELLKRENVDLVFTPKEETIYPRRFQTTVIVSEVTKPLEGVSRHSHFQGVTTVVAKLFNIVNPDSAYFGQKDAQQVAVVKRMVKDLNFDVEIVVCPIVREADGLAMSSRNTRLTPAERAAAPVLFRALSAAQDAVKNGERDASRLRQIMVDEIECEPLSRRDYVSVAHPDTLEELEQVHETALLSGAIFVGNVRLIDNVPI